MTAFAELFTGRTADPEERPVSTPLRNTPAIPGTSSLPWFYGVPGLDPAVPAADVQWAAECSAMACAVQVMGVWAGQGMVFRASPVKKWLRWLTDAGEYDCRKRILALRLVVERAALLDPDEVLRSAQDIAAACSPG